MVPLSLLLLLLLVVVVVVDEKAKKTLQNVVSPYYIPAHVFACCVGREGSVKVSLRTKTVRSLIRHARALARAPVNWWRCYVERALLRVRSVAFLTCAGGEWWWRGE